MTAHARKALDPVRARIEQRARAFDIRMIHLGPLVGRSASYMHNYLRRCDPSTLPRDVRARLADVLQMPEEDLCAPGQVTAAGVRVGTAAAPFSTALNDLDLPPMVAGATDVPLFGEDERIERAAAREWAPRPSHVPFIGGMFAVIVNRGSPRCRAGDTVYVANRRPRVGDIAVALCGDRVEAIGELSAIDDTVACIDTGTVAPRVLDLTRNRVLKVTTIATA